MKFRGRQVPDLAPPKAGPGQPSEVMAYFTK
jgi:hypothetical protein